jgi:hypothetical protein
VEGEVVWEFRGYGKDVHCFYLLRGVSGFVCCLTEGF